MAQVFLSFPRTNRISLAPFPRLSVFRSLFRSTRLSEKSQGSVLLPVSQDPSMAASVLESHVVPRPHSGHATASAPRAATVSVSATFGSRKAPILPESRGLRLARCPRRVASTAGVAGGKVRRRGSIVCEAQEATIEVPDVTQSTWQTLVLESDIPVLVEFWAPWCGPCRMILPLIGKLSKVYEGKLKCLKLNTDENQDVATKYGIRSIPTIMIFKDGEKKDAVIGAVPESTLVTCIEKFIGR